MPETTIAKLRVHELAKLVNQSNKTIMTLLETEYKLVMKSHASSVDAAIAEKIIAKFKTPIKESPKLAEKPATPTKTATPTNPTSATVASPTKPTVVAAAPTATKPSVATRANPTPTTQASGAKRVTTYTPPQKSGNAPYNSSHQQRRPAGTQSPLLGTPAPNAATNGGKGKATVVSTPKPAKPEPVVPTVMETVEFEGTLTVRELASLIQQKETDIIRHLFMKGIMVNVNQTLDYDAMFDVARGFEIEPSRKKKDDMSLVEISSGLDKAEETTSTSITRSPVISIMGHVDHGKTSLLDAIRETRQRIVDGEAGGITQTIGAYCVEKEGQRIVFLDTPGHEAFTSMRMRGAKATDIAILVVAADDGVMPQTIEAINHAKAAGIPIIVAVNKIDKEGADPDRVLTALMSHGVTPEKWGGDVITVEVSALQRLGIDDLLENIVVLSELMELKADPTAVGEGVIIEASLHKQKGPIASILVQNGTLRVGDNLLMGSVGGRVRALLDEAGNRLQEAGPSTPVEILGLNDVPRAGEPFIVYSDDKAFKQALSTAKITDRDARLSARNRNAGGLTRSLDDENKKELRVVLKADTQGSLEAALGSINKLGTTEVQVNVLHAATGDITEADVMLATASEAVIIGFNAREDVNAVRIAEQENVVIHRFDIIYHMVERIEKLMLGQLDAEIVESESGKAEVRALFSVGKQSVVAGCMVQEGKLVRNGKITVLRAGKVVHEGQMQALKRFKDDVREVAQGFECGVSLAKYNELEEGDILVCVVQEERKRTQL
ncbi:MAG: translation initiation factor IF-2 [Candidatus Melainabacteria bacterium]|nr:translation initiation factor IF-2 [Candidatus Melainabacteria bacterium]